MTARILCWWFGHRWVVLAQDVDRATALMHLHTMAGTHSRCSRCAAEFNDLRAPRPYRIPDGYRIADLPISQRKA